MSLAPGDEFAGYTIQALLGTGGMGAVYLAKHPRLPRRDALKLLNPAFSADSNFRARFEREADLAAGLIHRNIVAVYDRGSVDGQLWIAMQHVAGTDAAVASRAGDGSMTPQRVVHIIAEVGAGLDYAHRAGLLHRDVKPANILLAAPDDPTEPELVLLTDFGIAKSTDEVQHLTGTGNLLATLAYASPEQIEAKPLDRRVDIYALGCVLYELLTGVVPFPEESPFATMHAHLTKPPPKPTALVPWLPKGLDDVVEKAMAKNPDDRYASCRELSLAARAALIAANPAASSPTRAEMSPPSGVVATPGHAPTAQQPTPEAQQAAAVDQAVQQAVSLTAPRPPYTVSVRRTAPADGTVSELGPVSTNYLGAAQRIELEGLLHRARFFDLPPRLVLEYIVPGDVFQEITVSNDEVSRTVGYEREGARHPAQLDEVVALLERIAGWQHHGQFSGAIPRGAGQVPSSWTPTGNVPPLGGVAHQQTEAHPPPVGVGVPGYASSGPHGTAAFPGGPGGMGPSGPPGGYGTGPAGMPGQYRQDTMTTGPQTGPHTGPSNAPRGLVGPPPAAGAQTQSPPKPARSRTWLYVAVAALVAVIAGGATLFFVTRSEPGPMPPPTPTGLAATADGRTVTIRWNPSSGATGYTLLRGTDQIYAGTNTSHVESDVQPGTYSYTVTASNASGLKSATSAASTATVTGPWEDVTFMVDEFADLLPPSPTEKGYADSTCSISSDTEGSGVDGFINCTDPNGIYYEVMHFPDVATRDQYLTREWITAGVNVDWDVDGVDQGELWRSPDEENSLPFILTGWDSPERELYLLYVHWSDHTTQELIDEWWKEAPF